MTTEQTITPAEHRKYKYYRRTTASDAVYGLGLIGAWIYFISTATTFWMGVLGFLKGIVWPAFLVFELLKYLNM
ncbi:MAG TPA: hypothetical protein VIH16_02230 [Bellilinea sp.]